MTGRTGSAAVWPYRIPAAMNLDLTWKPNQQEKLVDSRDWQALPHGVLLHIFCLPSTWQAPGSCLAAPVCRNWREAAAGCSGTHLLYHAHSPATTGSFASWLARNSPQLQALTISSSSKTSLKRVLAPLAKAAAAAAAAGTPLPLHTLRVLGHGPRLPLAGRLVSELHNLRTLQLNIQMKGCWTALPALLSLHLAPLQQATQLEELYLGGSIGAYASYAAAAAPWLPVSLKRLSWKREYSTVDVPSLRHLTQLTFLQLSGWDCEGLSSKLPRGLQQLELGVCVIGAEEVLSCRVVTRMNWPRLRGRVEQYLSSFANLRTLQVHVSCYHSPPCAAAVAQLPHLSTLRVRGMQWSNVTEDAKTVMPAISTIAASSSSLRHLHLDPGPTLMAAAKRLSQWTGLTRLNVSRVGYSSSGQPYTWVEALGQLPRLRWLSVPAGALQAGWAWLRGLQQLRVLVVQCRSDEYCLIDPKDVAGWLEGCSPSTLPPQLQVLGVSIYIVDGLSQNVAASLQLPQRRHLQHLLRGSGCEVVVGADLDEVADPTQQLAGLPVALQQVLA